MMMYVYKTLFRFPFTFKEPQRGESEIYKLHQFDFVVLDCFLLIHLISFLDKYTFNGILSISTQDFRMIQPCFQRLFMMIHALPGIKDLRSPWRLERLKRLQRLQRLRLQIGWSQLPVLQWRSFQMCLGLVQNGYTHLKKRGQQKYSCEADCTTCFLCHYSISEKKSSAPASGYKSSAPAAKAALSASVGTSSAQGSWSAPASVDQIVFPTTCGKTPHTPQWRKKCASERLKNNRTKQTEYFYFSVQLTSIAWNAMVCWQVHCRHTSHLLQIKRAGLGRMQWRVFTVGNRCLLAITQSLDLNEWIGQNILVWDGKTKSAQPAMAFHEMKALIFNWSPRWKALSAIKSFWRVVGMTWKFLLDSTHVGCTKSMWL